MPDIGSRAGQPDRGRWPWGLVGMLLMVLLIETELSRVGGRLLSFNEADWRRTARVAGGHEAARSEILCFGDSLVKTGIAPAVLEARLDRPAFNLAVMGGTTPASYFLLRRAFEAGARPRAIVVDANESQLWAFRCRDMVPSWAKLIGPVEALAMSKDEGDLGFFGPYLVNYLVPSVRFRFELRKATLDWLARRPPESQVPWQPVVDRQLAVNRGALFLSPRRAKDDPDPRRGGILSGVEEAMWYTAGWTAWPPHLLYLNKFLALAASRDIPVFFLISPIHPEVQAERERRGLDGAVTGLVREFHDRYPNVIVVDGRHAGLRPVDFSDACHLNFDGAMALSGSLAEVIARRLDGDEPGRWAVMPPDREPQARLAVEDVGESVNALIRLWLRR